MQAARNILAFIILVASAFLILIALSDATPRSDSGDYAPIPVDVIAVNPHVVTAYATEDSTNCYRDASTRSNGEGISILDIGETRTVCLADRTGRNVAPRRRDDDDDDTPPDSDTGPVPLDPQPYALIPWGKSRSETPRPGWILDPRPGYVRDPAAYPPVMPASPLHDKARAIGVSVASAMQTFNERKDTP